MMKRLLIICMLLSVVVNAEYTPYGYNSWIDGDKGKVVAHPLPFNYQTATGWDSINNTLQLDGDSVAFCSTGVLKPRINKNGQSSVTRRYQGEDYTITQKLLGVGFIKKSTKASQWIDSTMDWSNVSIDSNIISWTGVSPGIDYRIRKSRGQVQHGIFFKQGFLDSVEVLYGDRADSLDLALANVMVYTLSSNIDNPDSIYGDVRWRKLKQFGIRTFQLSEQRLHYPFDRLDEATPIRQYWERRGSKLICVEYVMLSEIMAIHKAHPTLTIWHDDSVTEQTGASDRDTKVILTDGTAFNLSGGVEMGNVSTNSFRAGGSQWVLTVAQGSTIDSAFLEFKALDNQSGTTCNFQFKVEEADDAAAFQTTGNSSQKYDEWNGRTYWATQVDWDGVGAWTQGNLFGGPNTGTEPNIGSLVAHVTDRGGWASDQNIHISYGDFDNTSTNGAFRTGRHYDQAPTDAVLLHVFFTEGAPEEAVSTRRRKVIIGGQ